MAAAGAATARATRVVAAGGPTTARTINGVFWRSRTGCPWRDLPGQYGKLADRLQTTSPLVDGRYVGQKRWTGYAPGAMRSKVRTGRCRLISTIARAHQHAAGAAREPARDDPPRGGRNE